MSTQTKLIGEYCTYKSKTYMIVSYDFESRMTHILNPIEGNNKLHVLASNLRRTKYEAAKCVEHAGRKYLVTAKALIISLTTGRVMKWQKNNSNRINILLAVK